MPRIFWWERTVDLANNDAEPRTFQALLFKKQKLSELEATCDERDVSRQARAAEIAKLRASIDDLEACLKREAEELSEDDEPP